MNDDIQFVNYAWGPLLLHFKYPKEDITKLKRLECCVVCCISKWSSRFN